MNRALGLVALTSLMSCDGCGPVRAPLDPPDVRSSVGLLRMGVLGTCSAVAVTEDVILTAKHCVESADGVEYSFKHRHADVLAVDDDSDLAVLRVTDGGLTPLPIRGSDPRFGQRVTAVAYPARTLMPVVGTWAGRSDDGGYGVVASVLWYGASGGAIVDDDGSLACVVSKKHPDYQGLTLCVPSDDVRRFLSSHLIDFRRG